MNLLKIVNRGKNGMAAGPIGVAVSIVAGLFVDLALYAAKKQFEKKLNEKYMEEKK